MESKGQKTEEWSNFWNGLTPESEIRMWDYYGLRPWILKYTPRFGKVLEAGCGLGRYNFYLSRFGIDIEGLDFEKKTIEFLNDWKIQNGFESCSFIEGDVTDLPYDDNSLSGYISLGVVEHFIEGPSKALNEAYRVLRPGGIAIITTPSISSYVIYSKFVKSFKRVIKKLLGIRVEKTEFFQYEYRPKTLKRLVANSGLKVTYYTGADLLFSLYQFKKLNPMKISRNSFTYWFANKFERTFIRNLGAQSVTISVKTAKIMHCFLCGKLNSSLDSLNKYTVPICNECSYKEMSNYYLKHSEINWHTNLMINPEFKKDQDRFCDYCSIYYKYDTLFENYGFNKNVCPECLKDHNVNLELANKFIQLIWRSRRIVLIDK